MPPTVTREERLLRWLKAAYPFVKHMAQFDDYAEYLEEVILNDIERSGMLDAEFMSGTMETLNRLQRVQI